MKKTLLLAILLIPFVSFASVDQNLRYGSTGQEVVELQEYLIDKGFLTGSATGNFYSLTRKAVVAYQNSQGLPATGYVGSMTREKINADLAKDTSEEETKVSTVNTPSNDTSILKTQLDALLAQVQTLIAEQQKATQATQQTTQAVQQVVQNTTTVENTPMFGSTNTQPVIEKTIVISPSPETYRTVEAGKRYILGAYFLENGKPINKKGMTVLFETDDTLATFAGSGEDKTYMLSSNDPKAQQIEAVGCPSGWNVGAINTGINDHIDGNFAQATVTLCSSNNLPHKITVTGNGISKSFTIGQ